MYNLITTLINQKYINSIQIAPRFELKGEDKDLLQHLTFNVQTYSAFRAKFSNLIKPVEDFIYSLSKEHQYLIFKMYRDIKIIESNSELDYKDNQMVRKMSENTFIDFHDNLQELVEKMDAVILDTFDKTNLFPQIKKYTITNFRFPGNRVKRPQDSNKTTFFLEELQDLTCLAMVCKMLIPIFGEIIGLFNNSSNLDKSLKELTVIGVTKSIIDKYFGHLRDKLVYYIKSRVLKELSPEYRQREAINFTLKGFDVERFVLYIYSTVLVKKCANINIVTENETIMIYIHSCIVSTIGSQLDSLGKKNKIMSRTIKSPTGDGDDDDLLEYELKHSFNIGVPMIIKKNIKYIIDQLIIKSNLKEKHIKEVSDYYYTIQMKPNMITEFILASVMSRYHNSGLSIKYADIKLISRLIAVVQLVITDRYLPKYRDIIFLLTMESSSYKAEKIPVDYKIISTKAIGEIYTNISQDLDRCFSYKHDFSTIINIVMTTIVEKNQLAALPETLYVIMNEKNINGEQINYDANVVTNVFEMLHVIENEF